MTIGIQGYQTWVVFGELLGVGLTVSVVGGVTVGYEVGSLMDECSSSRIDTGVRGFPEGTTEVDNSEILGIWSRDLSVTKLPFGTGSMRTDVGESISGSTGAVVAEA